jgi:L-ascorbate metabolism protein UlaG (beta-lactamase superfamily)
MPPQELKITFVSNAGFLLASPTHKVLIDALYSDGSAALKTITSDIMDARAPFDNINVCMITHYHKDHCDPELVNDYIAKHNTVSLVTTKPTIVFINGNYYEFSLLQKQFVELTPEVNHSVSDTVKNIPVKAFGLKHTFYFKNGIEMNENMLNVSFLFTMDGIKIFHSGDIKINAFQDYLARNKKWTDSVDVALLCYGLFESGLSDLEYIVTTLHPKYIVVMHVSPGQIEECTAKVEQFKTRFPNIIFLKHPLDSKTISLTGSKQ